MYLFLIPLFAAAAAVLSYRLLGKTKLPQWGRLILSLLLGSIVAIALFGAMICLSILAFQMNDPITM